jgi:dolichol-phosphate mannosyltransferase
LDNKPLIFIPTYNEARNVVQLYNHLKDIGTKIDILFLDDNSPDGTGEILEKLRQEDKDLFIIHRKEKLGIGSAHKEGIRWAYNKNYKILITMDSDYSHSPDDIEKFLKISENNDLIVGTRFAKKDGMGELELVRKLMSLIAHFMTKYLLKVPYDCTNGFRLYRLDKIPQNLFEEVKSHSYSFFFESLFIIHNRKFKVEEIAIKLGCRAYGDSNMSTNDVLLSIKTLLKLLKEKFF